MDSRETVAAGVLTRPEAAEFLRVHPRHVDAMIRRGELPAVRIGRRVLVPKNALIDVLERGLVAVTRPSPAR